MLRGKPRRLRRIGSSSLIMGMKGVTLVLLNVLRRTPQIRWLNPHLSIRFSIIVQETHIRTQVPET